jgi:2-amino-4-hydroxy-6-hydroxymethyldihydropteridine diphosphokinase
MNNLHRAYLNLGSNIEPELNLSKAIDLLKEYGEIKAVSHVWESKSVGYDGPNFLNACVLFLTESQPENLKQEIIHPIEAKLGRVRGADKNMPRTMDIDVVLFDEKPIMKAEYWDSAFVIVPLAELLPDFAHPLRKEKLSSYSEKLKNKIWIVRRDDVVIQK